MFKRVIVSGVAGFAVAAFASAQTNSAGIIVTDLGTSTDGTRVMHGYKAFLVGFEAVSLNISRVELEIAGTISQVWLDPTASGNYTQRTPGLYPIDLPTDPPLRFDSHFVGDPSKVVISAFNERESDPDFFLPRSNLLTNTPSERYIDSDLSRWPVANPYDNRYLVTMSYEIRPEFQSRRVDFAYVVTSDRAFVGARIRFADFPYGVAATGFLQVPEPATGLLLGSVTAIALRRRRVWRTANAISAARR